jgi:hypothetical protein
VSNLIKENKLHVIKINQPPEMRVEIFVVMKIMLWSSVQWCGRIPEGHTACIFRVKAAWSYHIIIWCHSPEDHIKHHEVCWKIAAIVTIQYQRNG